MFRCKGGGRNPQSCHRVILHDFVHGMMEDRGLGVRETQIGYKVF